MCSCITSLCRPSVIKQKKLKRYSVSVARASVEIRAEFQETKVDTASRMVFVRGQDGRLVKI